MWTYAGAAEALALGQDGKPVLDMHTQVTEERVCEGPLDFVTRYCRDLVHLLIAHAACESQVGAFDTRK